MKNKLLFSFIDMYEPYKGYIIPSVIIIACFLVFSEFIVPQVKGFFYLQGQINQERDLLQVTRQKLQFLSNMNDNELDYNVQLASSTLPTDKDFISILSAISQVAAKSNVSLGDYGIQAGIPLTQPQDTNALSAIEVSVVLNGNLQGLTSFMKNLSSSIPLSEVGDVEIDTSGLNLLKISFYYQPLSKTTFDTSQSIEAFSPGEQSLLDTLSLWQNTATNL